MEWNGMKLKSTECNVCFKDYIEQLRCIIYIAVEIDLLEIFIRICSVYCFTTTTTTTTSTNIYNGVLSLLLQRRELRKL